MAQTLEEWLNGEVKQLQKLPVGDLSNTFFFRDPIRPNFIDHEHFYSPADGTILYQRFIKDPSEPVVEIKGLNYTLQDVVGDDEYDKPSLVIGIFMSFYDVHINRVPYGGMLKYKPLDAIQSTNKPMLAVEKDILRKKINPANMEYLKYNERMWNSIYSPSLDVSFSTALVSSAKIFFQSKISNPLETTPPAASLIICLDFNVDTALS